MNATTAELLRKQEELEKKARELERRERELESHSLGPGAGKRENISRKHKEAGTPEAKKSSASFLLPVALFVHYYGQIGFICLLDYGLLDISVVEISASTEVSPCVVTHRESDPNKVLGEKASHDFFFLGGLCWYLVLKYLKMFCLPSFFNSHKPVHSLQGHQQKGIKGPILCTIHFTFNLSPVNQ